MIACVCARWSWLNLLLLLIYPSCSSKAGEGDSTGSVRENLEVMQGLVADLTREIVARTHMQGGDSLETRIHSGDDRWIPEQALIGELKSNAIQVFTSGDSAARMKFLLDVGSFELNVRYEDIFRDGLFGMKKMRRKV